MNASLLLRRCLEDPLLGVMNFLNEVAIEYPNAVSFAAGRPPEDLFDVERCIGGITQYIAARPSNDAMREWNELGQYNRTNGIIRDVVTRHLAADEGIHVDPGAVVVTVGAQEAMATVLLGLFEPGKDILLVGDPTYIGITALARLLGIRVWPIPMSDCGLEADEVEAAIEAASRHGRVKALYDVPDFNNPLGARMPLAERRSLLDVCRRHDVLILEDNPYGMYAYEGDRIPALKALDDHATVIYIGTFSKTLFPALRLGYLVADQLASGSGRSLGCELSRVKSVLTINTSPILQAMTAGVLADAGFSLDSIVEPKRRRLRHNRDVLLDALAEAFRDAAQSVTWNRPAGGFFLTLSLPFEFGIAETRRCAEGYGVLVVPVQFMSIRRDRRRQVRLSFASVDEQGIRDGVRRLARFVRDQARASSMNGTRSRRPTD